MSDESDDKTEAPTPHRLEKAREEGQIPRSRELTSLLILLVCLLVIKIITRLAEKLLGRVKRLDPRMNKNAMAASASSGWLRRHDSLL